MTPFPHLEPNEAIYIDLDGTLVASDTLHESAIRLAKQGLPTLLRLPQWLSQGKARLKDEIARRVDLDVTLLPYEVEVLEFARQAKQRGHRVVLATAANQSIANAVAAHLGFFDDVISSDACNNLSGQQKLAAIRRDAAEHGAAACYVGNASVDLEVWRGVRSALVVSPSEALASRARAVSQVVAHIRPARASLRDYLFGIRLHQWVKNLLIFVPLLPILGELTPSLVLHSLVAFLSFGLVASSVYLLNDLLDLDADRAHPRKRLRPLACGVISIATGCVLAVGLLIAGFGLAWFVSPTFLAIMGLYVALTNLYSFKLKQMVLLDVFALAMLYTLRILGGAAAAGVQASAWLLCFSLFIFVSLALAKRYTEVEALKLRKSMKDEVWARGYAGADQNFILSMGLASGQMAILVLCLYFNDPAVSARYASPRLMWLIAPLLLYWVSRTWLMARRGQLHDDPIVFALRDRVSRLVVVAIVLTVVAASGLIL